MPDIDALRKREIPYCALTDAQGISIGGTSTLSLLRARGMAAACQVDATGTALDASTLRQILARGIQYFCQVTEFGVDPVSAATLAQLMAKGIKPQCPVDVNGIAQGGTSTIDLLRKRGIGYFCPLDETGTATTLGGGGGSPVTGNPIGLLLALTYS